MTDIVKMEDLYNTIQDYARTFLSHLNDKERVLFLELAKGYKLNPFKKEIYCIKYGNKCNILVGFEVYIKRGERSGKLNGWGVELIGTGKELKAIITINRKDWEHPFKHEVYYEEYKQATPIWKDKPRTMLRKVAISQGFRLAFSECCGGMPYSAEELPPLEQTAINLNKKPQLKLPTMNKIDIAKKWILESKFTEDLNLVEEKLKILKLKGRERDTVVKLFIDKRQQLDYEHCENDPKFQEFSKDVDVIAERFDNEHT